MITLLKAIEVLAQLNQEYNDQQDFQKFDEVGKMIKALQEYTKDQPIYTIKVNFYKVDVDWYNEEQKFELIDQYVFYAKDYTDLFAQIAKTYANNIQLVGTFPFVMVNKQGAAGIYEEKISIHETKNLSIKELESKL